MEANLGFIDKKKEENHEDGFMIKNYSRPFTDNEKNWINKDIKDMDFSLKAEAESFRKLLWFLPVPILFGIALLILFGINNTLGIIGGVAVICSIIGIWACYDVLVKKEPQTKANAKAMALMEEILKRNIAEVIHCTGNKVVELEHGMGKDFLFQVEDSKLLFLSGPHYSGYKKFPNSDFEIVFSRANNNELAFFTIYCNGKILTPSKISLGKKISQNDKYPKNLDIISGKLDELITKFSSKAV